MKVVMTDQKLEIYDIMACNVYVDYDFATTNEQHKFLIAFVPLKDVFIPDLIESITAYGPNGYVQEIANQKYSLDNVNGYITDVAFNSCWYMINMRTGFMEEGEYKIEVKCKNGDVVSKSRCQKDAPGKRLVKTYLEHKDVLFESFAPGTMNKMPEDATLNNVKIKWKTVYEVAGIDAYSIFRISKGATSQEFNIQDLTWWDNVFVLRNSNPTYGLNKGEVIVQKPLKSNTSYAYFVEVTDSNTMGETNICIFQPHQLFSTPKKLEQIVSASNS